MGKKIRVAILFGGSSSEYAISLRSTMSVLNGLDEAKYEKVLVGISRKGEWYLYTGPIELIGEDAWERTGKVKRAFFSSSPGLEGLIVLSNEQNYTVVGVDVVFPVLHGRQGEDGTVQGLLEVSGLPYVGCGVLSSALCMDKAVAHVVLESVGIPTTPWFTVHRDAELAPQAVAARVKEELGGFPVFVKPANSGSAIGVSRADTPAELGASLALAFAEDQKVLIEVAVTAHEVECAVLGNDKLIISQLGEIVTPDFYDYEAKYENDSAQLLLPALILEKQAEQVRDLAGRAYRAMECKGLARIDFFAKEDGSVFLNEINTLPGFTSISMYPKLMEHLGISFSELLDHLVELAMERKQD